MKRVLNCPLPLIVNSPAKVFNLNYFKLIYQAGGLPLLDTEYFENDECLDFLNQLKKEKILFGVKIQANNKILLDVLNKNNVINLDLIIFSYGTKNELDNIKFDNRFYKIFVEAKDIDIAEKLEKLNLNGIILKGYEASGRVSRYTSFILMQWYLQSSDYPLFIHGGAGFHTASGMFAAGASGIVLNDQLYLTDEAPVSNDFKKIISTLEEKDTAIIGEYIGNRYRVFSKLGTKITKDLKEKESLAYSGNSADFNIDSEIKDNLLAIDKSSENPIQELFFLGQDALFAKHFIKNSTKLKDVIHVFFKNIGENLEFVDKYDPMVEGSALTKDHLTKYPVIQGPMGNISDNADFAQKIFQNGALPFFAMGNLPKNIAEKVLIDACEKVENFGAGLIGLAFNKPLAEHIELIRKYNVKFAIVAGGVPSQVNELEANGIKAYLHTPSLQILENALNNCLSHRFIFEGTEAGGHVGHLTSLVLWELAIERLSKQNQAAVKKQYVVFAGGICSSYGSAFISGMASKFSSLGAHIGISVATSYMFTKEIVETSAMKKLYQDVLKKETTSVVIAGTIGLPTRTVLTPFTEEVLNNEHNWVKDRTDLKERKIKFESLSSGSLLIAAKAFLPNYARKNESDPEYIYYDQDEQFKKGNFMTGDGLAIHNTVITIKDIHDNLFNTKDKLYKNLNELEILTNDNCEVNDEIAVIGMAGMYPDAKNNSEFWQNIISKKYSITEIPEDRTDIDLYYDKDFKTEDATYSHLAGVIKDFKFDHEKFGYSEQEAKYFSRSQKMVLQVAFDAVNEGGYLKEKTLPKKRTGVIIGNCGETEFIERHHKYIYPEIEKYLNEIASFTKLEEHQKESILNNIKQELCKDDHLNEKFENTMMNINAARIAKHLGIEGTNYSLDAACATSLVAIDCAMKSLLSNEYDYMITGGVHANLTQELLVGFSKMTGLSDDGSFPFDERANGFVLGEGAGVLLLKRMKDAVRDGDKIHAVIKAVGMSSDGKGKAIAAPSSLGQSYALKRCFEKMKSPVSFDDVDYIEAHGTSTLAGDEAEVQTIRTVYQTKHPVGISSIKSQIGHLISSAGLAGITKAILAIENKTLPPNGQFKKLSAKIKLAEPFYIIENPKAWDIQKGKTRKAGISSFGFGGINTHVIIEEYNSEYKILPRKIFSDPSKNFNDDRIVVIGTGCLLPDAFNTEDFWNNMQNGRKSFYDIPENRVSLKNYSSQKDKRFNIPDIKAGVIINYKFNGLKYKIPPTTLKYIDKHQLYAVEAASQAIEQANLKSRLTNGNNVGVVMGNTMSGENFYETIARIRIPSVCKSIAEAKEIDNNTKKEIADDLKTLMRKRFPKSNEDTFPGYIANLISGRIANIFNCNGANFIIDSASVSSANAISMAVKGLKNNDYEYVITGGSDSNFSPSVLRGLQQWGMLSAKENEIFNKNSSGINPAEGAAVFVMTKYKTAVENNIPILAEMDDFKIISNHSDTMLTAPDKSAYKNAIEEFYKTSSLTPSQVQYLEVYGAGNILFDTMELQAIVNKFHSNIYFGSIKSNFGYLKSAHPATVLLKLVLMNQFGKVLPNYINNRSSIVNNTDSLKFNNETITLQENENKYFAANIYGIGGNHGHFVVKNTPLFLKQFKDSTKLSYSSDLSFDVPVLKSSERKVALLLSGQGSQYVGMLKELYNSVDTFHSLMDKGEVIFKGIKNYSLLDIIFENEDKLILTCNTQPAIFLASACVFDYLKDRGLEPEYFIGHSLGEFSALYCSGMLNFDDAFKLIIKRAELMQEAANQNPGSMVAVFKNETDTGKLVNDSRIQNIYIANKNSEEQTVVSGENAGISIFIKYLKELGIAHVKVNVATAFHTPFFKFASQKLRTYLNDVSFNKTNYNKVYSNVTGELYPQDEEAIKDLLAKQMISPVEFVKTLKNASDNGVDIFIEAGPNMILTNLVKKSRIQHKLLLHSINAKIGEIQSLDNLIKELGNNGLLKTMEIKEEKSNTENIEFVPMKNKPVGVLDKKNEMLNDSQISNLRSQISLSAENASEFTEFINEKKEDISKLLFENFQKFRKEKVLESQTRFGLFSGNIVVAGVAVGLPGSGYKVFDTENFDKILSGTNFIEALSQNEKDKMFDKNITRLNKESDGNAKFQELKNTDEVIQLAAKLGYFDLKKEYGIDFNYDITYSLAIAAGIESLKDANIPLVMQYKKTSSGSLLPEGYALPAEMQDRTGVIFSSVFHGFETIIDEVTKYYKDKFINKPLNEFENIYFYLMEHVKEIEIKRAVTGWFNNMKYEAKGNEPYHFNRKLLLDIAALGSTHFAQIIKAKGPNTQISATCTSTTQAIGIAEDWIRTGRCDRVIIIGGEAATSDKQHEWIGASFLSIGAATDKRTIKDAALPFDERRNGLVLGSAAVSIIIEREEELKKRGLNGEAQILGTYIGNSAYHASKIDPEFFAGEMKKFFDKSEKIYNLKKDTYTKSLLFMSHESYTPGSGGPATAEVNSLKKVFPEHYKNITITNIKGLTGSTLGAATEDAVMVKALQKNKAPAIPNLKIIPEQFKDMKFSDGKDSVYEYGVHLAAGFGSYFSFLFIKKIVENPIENNEIYKDWLKKISNQEEPQLVIINNTLCIKLDNKSIKKVADKPVEKEKQKENKPVPAPVFEKTNTDKIVSEINVSEVKTEKTFSDNILSEIKEETPVPDNLIIIDTDKILSDIKSIIAEQTGYTSDLLEDNLDLEADLGIDTVKQIEIFGKITSNFNLALPENLKLNTLNTIAKIREFIINSSLTSDSGNSEPQANVIVSENKPIETNTQLNINPEEILSQIKAIIAEQTGYTSDLLEDNLDLEADLGIDTVKQIEIFGKITSNFNLALPENLKLNTLNTIAKIREFIINSSLTSASGSSEPETNSIVSENKPTEKNNQLNINSEEILSQIKAIIAEQTGYTSDLLEDNLDLEADLGIDTVKQIEIFGKITSQFNLTVPENLKLNTLNTIAKIKEFIVQNSQAITTDSNVTEVEVKVTENISKEKNDQTDIINSEEILSKIRFIIAEQTGYTQDLLEDNLDLEADLGIDTVKQIEIFGKITSQFNLTVPENLKLNTLNTIGRISEFVKTEISQILPEVITTTTHLVKEKSDTATLSEQIIPMNGNVVKEIKIIISEITGNPVSMLDEELMLEDELGINSIKMVEICERVSAKFKFTIPENFRLSELTSIAEITKFVKKRVTDFESCDGRSSKIEKTKTIKPELSDKLNIKRFVIDAVKVDNPQNKNNIFDGKTFIISTDKFGFSDSIITKIHALNGNTITIGNNENDNYKTDLFKTDNIDNSIENLISKETNIDGIIHLFPLDCYFEAHSEQDKINSSVKSLFLIIKKLFDQLNRKETLISTLTFDSVIFPYSDKSLNIHSESAGLSGMLKTVNKELVECLVKVVDFRYDKPETNIDQITDIYISELMSGDVRVETGYKDGNKYAIKITENELPLNNGSFIKDGSTILITGGSRGITFEIAKKLIEKFKVNLLILGKTNLSSIDKKYLNDLTDEKIIFNELKEKMKGAKPLDIRYAVENILKIRETILNIEYLKSLGTDVYYETVNVCDYDSIKIIADNYSNIDGIIHAAGLEESVPISKKNFSNFNKIFDTKVYGALNLLNAFDKSDFKYFITFSSVAAKFGNIGQTDYSAANEMLCKIAHEQQAKHNDRIYKVFNWTAWKGTGMANKETITKVLNAIGVEFIEINQGVNFFINELSDKETNEVIISGISESIDTDKIFFTKPAAFEEIKVTNEFCFIEKILKKDDNYCESLYTVSLNKDFYMSSHYYDGTAVVPGTFLSEIMVQNAKTLAPFKYLYRVSDLNMGYFIKLINDKDKVIRITSQILEKTEDEVKVYSRITTDTINYKGDIAEKDKQHAFCTVYFSKQKPPVDLGEYNYIDFSKLKNVVSSKLQTLYNGKFLFMGPKMQPLNRLLYLDNKIAIAELRYSDINILKNYQNFSYNIDPILYDGCFQIGGFIYGMVNKYNGLPEYIESTQLFQKIEINKSYYGVAFLKANGLGKDKKNYLIDMIMFDTDWNPVLNIYNFRGYVTKQVPEELLAQIKSETIFEIESSKQNNEPYPFIDNKVNETENSALYKRTLDIGRDLFLSHHVKNEIPLFLASTGIEAMAEAATEMIGKQFEIKEISDFKIPYGIKILKGRPKEILIHAEKGKNDLQYITKIYSEFNNKNGEAIGNPTTHFNAVINFGKELYAPEKFDMPEFQNMFIDGSLHELLYHPERLFMDDMFKTISDVMYFDNTTLVTKLHNNSNKQCFRDKKSNNFITDIFTLDGMFQSCGVITFINQSIIILPYEITKIKFYGKTNPENEYYCCTRILSDNNETAEFEIRLTDKDNNLLVHVEKMIMVKVYKIPEEYRIYNKIRALSTI